MTIVAHYLALKTALGYGWGWAMPTEMCFQLFFSLLIKKLRDFSEEQKVKICISNL
jgi:hypothetical protein